MKNILLGVSVWGTEYCDIFINYTLPSLMAEGNLPALCKQRKVHLAIHTTPEDEIYLLPHLEVLRQMGIIITCYIQTQFLGDKYLLLGLLQGADLQLAKKLDADYHLLMPDYVYSENCFIGILKAAERGHKAITRLVVSTTLDSINYELTHPRSAIDLATLSLLHIHPGIKCWLADNNSYPHTHVMAWEGNDTLRMCSPHQTVIYLDRAIIRNVPNIPYLPLDNVLDKIVSKVYCPKPEDEICVIEVSSLNSRVEDKRKVSLDKFCSIFWEDTKGSMTQWGIWNEETIDAINRTTLLGRKYFTDDDISKRKIIINNELMKKRPIESPDWPIYKELMECVGSYMGQVNCRHERYEKFPYPQRLGELSELLKLHMLREAGDIKGYLRLDNELSKLGRQPCKHDIIIKMMMEWLQGELDRRFIPKENTLVISTLVWGKYTDKILNYAFKSMMAEGNLPALIKEKSVIIHIQTDTKTRDIIEQSDIAHKIKNIGINFEYSIIPDELISMLIDNMDIYWMVGAAASVGLHYAKKIGATFHHSYPDIIYSDKYFSELLRLSQSHKSILAPGHRADESMLLPFLLPYENDVISIPSADLMALHMNSMHMNAWSCIVNNRDKNWVYPKKHVLMWESENVIWFNCPHLNALWLDNSIIKDLPDRYFMSLDSELDLVCKGEDFYIPQENDDLYLAEFSEQARYDVQDWWCNSIDYSYYMWKTIAHRDTLKFFLRGMRVKLNREIRPMPANAMNNGQIAAERAYLFNEIVSVDPYSGIQLARPRSHEGRIFKV